MTNTEIDSELQHTLENFKGYLFQIDDHIIQDVVQPPRGTAESRMNIYSDAYILRLDQTLKRHFPILQQLFSADEFFELTSSYIYRYPSCYDNIRFFGDGFVDYLREYPATAQRTYLAEIANFEWELGNAIDAPDGQVVPEDMLKQCTPEQWPLMQFVVHPAVKLLWFHWDVPKVWQAIKEQSAHQYCDEQHADDDMCSSVVITPEWIYSEVTKPCLIWRQAQSIHYQEIEVVHAQMIQLFQEGCGVMEVCTELLEYYDEQTVSTKLAETAQLLCVQGGLSAINFVQVSELE